MLAKQDELFSTNEQLAMAGFLAGYGGLTRDADTLDLRQCVAWCTEHRLAVFGACRADIECFARHLESRRRARATIPRRLCTVARFYRYAEQEGLIANSPSAHVRRPRLDHESHATGLDRNEVRAMLVAAGLAGARDHALISRLALNGLRVSEAIGANGERIDRHAAGRIVRRIARRAGIAKRVGPYAPSRVHHRRARRWRSPPSRGAPRPQGGDRLWRRMDPGDAGRPAPGRRRVRRVPARGLSQ